MDIVYIVKKTEKNEELKYSLRSLSNINHEKVFIVGDLPHFINDKTVFYIPTNILESRYITTTYNIKAACNCSNLSDDFILMNDDFYILNKINYSDLNLDRGLLSNVVKYYHIHHKPLTKYDNLVEKSLIHLKEMGFENPISFELHCPIILNKSKFLSMLDKITDESLHCCKRTLYGNLFIKNSKSIDDVKVLSSHKIDFEKWNNMNLLSSSRIAFNKVENFLRNRFPDKCKYEI